MTITNPMLLDAYARIAEQTYDDLDQPSGDVGSYTEIHRRIDGPLGFQARAFFNSANNELVIAFTGTEGARSDNLSGSEFLADFITNFSLAVTGTGPQVPLAEAFIAQALIAAQLRVGPLGAFDTTYVGHSLGGFLAQVASASGNAPEGEVIAFNAPGAGGFLGLPQSHPFPEENFTYVYSDPDTWGLIGSAVHSVGTPLSDNIYVVDEAEGHAINNSDGTGLSDVLNGVIDADLTDDSIFLPVDGALQLLGATALLAYFDDGSSTPSDGIVTGTSAGEVIDSSYTDSDGDVVSAGADNITAAGGNDTVDAGAGDDTIRGGNGNDLLVGGLGADTIDGGAGSDTADYSGSDERVYVNLRSDATTYTNWGASGDVLSNIENVTGSAYNDYI